MDSLGVTDGDILALFNNIEEVKDFMSMLIYLCCVNFINIIFCGAAIY